MPVIIDIKKDLRYQRVIEQGIEQGIEKKAIDTARKMFENGLAFSLIQNVTGLETDKLEKIARSVSKP